MPVVRSTGIAQLFGAAEAMLESVDAESTKNPIVTTTYKTRPESGVVLHDLGRVAADHDTARMLLMAAVGTLDDIRSEEHTSDLHTLMRLSYAVFALINKNTKSAAADLMVSIRPHAITDPTSH